MLNTWYSYYDGGQIMGHLMDFAIRHDTDNQKSLDDWMRLMYSRYALPKPGFQPDDAIKAASEVSGKNVNEVSDFFHTLYLRKRSDSLRGVFRVCGNRGRKEARFRETVDGR